MVEILQVVGTARALSPLIVCRNPALAAERACRREDLLEATERDLAKIEELSDVANGPYVARLRSRSKSAPCLIATKWPSTLPSPSPTIVSRLLARMRRSPTRRRSMVSTSSAPACPKRPWMTTARSAPTSHQPKSSAPFVLSKPSTFRSARAITGSPQGSSACVPMHARRSCRRA